MFIISVKALCYEIVVFFLIQKRFLYKQETMKRNSSRIKMAPTLNIEFKVLLYAVGIFSLR